MSMSADSDDEGVELLTSNVYKPPTSTTTTTFDDSAAATTTATSLSRRSDEYTADNTSLADSVSWSPIDEAEELLPAATFTPFPSTTPSTAETTPTTLVGPSTIPPTAATTTTSATYVKRSEDGFGSAPGSGDGSGTSTASPRSPRTPTSKITGWTTGDCAVFLASLGFEMYCETFLENEIVGEALVALNHDELRELGISSAGHRLTILKRIYEIKRRQGVSFHKDHYVPITAEGDHDAVTKTEMAHLVQSIRQRDYRIRSVEIELRKLADDYRRMREEFLPVVKMAKDRSQPLPFQPAGSGTANGTLTPDYNNGGGGNGKDSESGSTLAPEKPSGSSLSRTLSKKLFPSKHSPTHAPKEAHDRERSGTPVPSGNNNNNHDHPTLDPLAAAFSSTGHLPNTATNNNSPKTAMSLGGNQPSPTSPGFFGIARARTPHGDHSDDLSKDRMNSPGSHKTPPPATTVTPAPSISGSTLHHAPSVRRAPGIVTSSSMATPTMASSSTHHHHDSPADQTTKSFRVTMEDPCYKVLPAALKKYNIDEDWRLYALYIVCGEHERCLALDEKPLILFKQLDREGRKPVFMLRRTANGGAAGGGGNTVKLGGGGFAGGSSSSSSHNTPSGGHGGGNGGHSGGHQHQHLLHHQHQQHQHQHTIKLPGGGL